MRAGDLRGWVRADLAGAEWPALFGALQPLPGAKGRGGIGCMELAGVQLVVRPYRRGGALASLLRDRYRGPQRALGELAALVALREQGVPVVVPVAALAQRHGAFHRLRLCTERLPEAMPAPAFLAAEPAMRRCTASAIGTLLRLAFAAGLHHPDLHLDNVLCQRAGERVRAVLVDLDRATVRPPLSAAEQDSMLVRLLRHVERHRKRLAACPTRSECMRCLRALGWSRDERHAGWRRLQHGLQRALRRRWLR